jgi:hypothetical protein
LNGPARVQMLVAKGQAAAGNVSAALGETQPARALFEKAIAEYRRLQTLPGFAWKRELLEAEADLAKLRP